MMINAALGFLDLFRWVFPLLKVDYGILRNILWVKLTNDARRTYLNISAKEGKKGKEPNAFAKLVLLHFFTGAFMVVIVLEIKSIFLAQMMVHVFILFMAVLSLLTHFTSVLLDTTDNRILLPRPVDGRTVFMARVLHILFYLFTITLALAFPSGVAGTIKYGAVFGIVFFVTVILSTMLSVFLTYLLYLGLLGVTGGDRFRDIITYLQIVLPMLLMVFFFIGDGDFKLEDLMVSMGTWSFFVPPAWFGGSVEALVTRQYHSPYIWYIVLSVAVPLGCMLSAVLALAPSFNRKLSRMDTAVSKKTPPRGGAGVVSLFSRLLGRSGTERASFEMIWKLAARDRKFKLNIYPILGTYFMFFFLIGFAQYKKISVALDALPGTQRYIGLLYISVMLVMTAITQLSFSESYKAAWMYGLFPIARPGEMLGGAFKMTVVKFGFPVLITAGFVLAVWGVGTIDDIVFAFLGILLFCLVLAFITLRCLPFSQKPSVTSIGGTLFQTLTALVLYIGLGYGHYRLLEYPYAVTVGLLPMALLLFYLFRKYKHTTWEVLE